MSCPGPPTPGLVDTILAIPHTRAAHLSEWVCTLCMQHLRCKGLAGSVTGKVPVQGAKGCGQYTSWARSSNAIRCRKQTDA